MLYSFVSLNRVQYVFLIFCNFEYRGLPCLLCVILCDVCYFIVLYFIVLHRVVLYCIIFTVLHRIVLYCIV